jgi:hypothetical protein
MREWMYAVVPAAFAGYFVAYPDELAKAVDWITALLN